jgi:Fur family transcriptional regulator, zinc uptake regulator
MSFPAPGHDHRHCTDELLGRAEVLCQRRGARFTAQRRDILCCVAESHAAAGAYEIIGRMAGRGPRPSPITVYRALDFLVAHGLVHKIESRNAYVACTHAHEGTPAALLVCEGCGAVSEVDASESAARLTKAAAAQGFRPREIIMEMSGRCGACA